MEDILKLLKSAKEAELEAIKMLMEKEIEKDDQEEEAAGKRPKKKTTTAKGRNPAKAKKVEEESEDSDDYDSMKADQLYKLCCERGISSKVKNDRKKDTLIKVLRENDGAGNDADEEDWTDEDWTDDMPDYDSMKSIELYNECKKRGISVKPKRKASEYIKLLKANDAESGDGGEEDEEDWELDD